MMFIEFLRVLFELIGHLAWPATILVIVYIFKKPISELLKRIKKISSGDKSIELDLLKIVSQQQLYKKNLDVLSVTKETCNYETYLELVNNLAYAQIAMVALGIRDKQPHDVLRKTIKFFELSMKKLEKETPNDKSVIKLRELSEDVYEAFNELPDSDEHKNRNGIKEPEQ